MDADRKVIGLTSASQELLARIEELDWFSDGQDIARFALAIALRDAKEIGSGSVSVTETRYGAGLFDNTGEIRTLIQAKFPECVTPVRFMEYLVDEGLRTIGRLLDQGANSPDELMNATVRPGKAV